MSQLIHTLDSHVDLVHDGVTLFSYVYRPLVPAIESPRPYFHPLRTLRGNVVSGFRPHDHRWHHGLSMTCANLSGYNFWGGPTYLRDAGYRQLDNNGRQVADNFYFQSPQVGDASFNEFFHDVVWGNLLLGESRSIESNVSEEQWSLDLKFSIENADNCTGEKITWGSPTTQGRANAGYGGLFWRGPRDFINGQVLMSDGREGADLMGKKSPWLAYIGQHDGKDEFSTLIFVDNAENPRHPTPWFVRNTTPMVCPYFAFHDEYKLMPNQSLTLNYRIIIADGQWDRERIEAMVS